MEQPPVAVESLPELETPDLPAPLRRIVLVGVLSIASGLGVVRLMMGRTSQSFPGQVTARIVPLTADRAGVLSAWLVEEGAQVRIGDELASISITSLVEEKTQLEQDIARLNVDLERGLAQAELDLEWRLKDINADIFSARLQSAELLEEKYQHEMEQVALSELLKDNSTTLWATNDSVIDAVSVRKPDMRESRLSTVLRVEAANNSAEVCGAQVELCEEQVEALEELKDSLPDRIRKSLGIESIERQLVTAQTRLDQLNDGESELTLTSTVIGQTGVFLREQGDYVSPGDRIVEIFDDVQRYVTADIPSSCVDDYSVGTTVVLSFAGNEQRTGRVVMVAPQAVSRTPGAESSVRVHVEPSGVLWPSVPIDSQVMVRVK
ncbi:MAG: hypothetical protein KDA93_02930 [Planctomycetaceae bacterium]|nr:hypothetical protein [Planctomycetaceae bacterium]